MGVSAEPVVQFDLDDIAVLGVDLSPLVQPFTTQEIDRIIKIMPLDKAPGPDGWHVHEKMLAHHKARFLQTLPGLL